MSEREGILPQVGVSELADRIRSAIGAGMFEEVSVLLPQFERVDANAPWWFPTSAADLDSIKDAPSDFLRRLGLGIWSNDNGIEHWLYPGEWYDSIPEGYPMACIDGETEEFKKGETDNDIRYGCLAYGFTRPILALTPPEPASVEPGGPS
jgi:hypothetical protein